jgi:hypothetical protein
MQRRSFLRNAACVGACASLFSPVREAFAAGVAAEGAVSLRFERLAAQAAPADASSLQLRVTPQQFGACGQALRVRAWFAADEVTTAFDLASFGRQGASQRLRFTTDARRLLGFELGDGQGFDDCATMDACRATAADGAMLGPGKYRLSLLRDGQALAAVELDVSVAAA